MRVVKVVRVVRVVRVRVRVESRRFVSCTMVLKHPVVTASVRARARVSARWC